MATPAITAAPVQSLGVLGSVAVRNVEPILDEGTDAGVELTGVGDESHITTIATAAANIAIVVARTPTRPSHGLG